MKNVKFALVAAIVSLAMLSYAADIPDRPGRIVKISLEQAKTNPGLVKYKKACLSHLNQVFLNFNQIRLRRSTITGSAAPRKQSISSPPKCAG